MEIRIPSHSRNEPVSTPSKINDLPNVAQEVGVATLQNARSLSEGSKATETVAKPDLSAPYGLKLDGTPRPKPGRKAKVDGLAVKHRYAIVPGIAGSHPNTHVKVFARPYTEEAVTILVEIMRDTEAPVQARVSAATQVLDRAWGKPKETLELEAPAEGLRKVLNDISSEDLTDLVRALRNPPIDVTPTKATIVDAKKPGP